MSSLNRAILVGRLTRDVELKYTPSGVPVANFTVAVDRNAKPDEQGNKETDFIPCVAWRQSAEYAGQYLGKGALVAVDGRIRIRKWQDPQGQQRIVTEVVCDRVQGLESKRAREEREAAPADDRDTHDPFEE